MNLMDYFDKSSINLALNGSSKEEILSELVDILVDKGVVSTKEKLYNSLLEREGLGSTGIGHGVAIPHGRSPELDQPAVALGRSVADVDFDAIDGHPTRIFFLLVAPENGTTQHLHLLAKIARLMKDAKTRKSLMEVQTPEEVLELFQSAGA
ncbi:MAG: PTS sugar transporter subunit IIA [Deltaproteobacteria bacterium]|nr:PTS sugar transporter subunit IIA [Deltaproteobacteria bacterium]